MSAPRRDPSRPLRDVAVALAGAGRVLEQAIARALWDLDLSLQRARLRQLHAARAAAVLQITLHADTGPYVDAMTGIARSVEKLRWQVTIRREQALARQFLDDLVDEAWASYGWARPRVGCGDPDCEEAHP
ncbi:hypothetical protein [Nocardioides lijunqiniae]|uniref:hypothetical protein n=1 Tax=Nocardioides lijunqiniae TaxID=2760832 RepID=UPI0018783561|nr:hypothetical protein [Nocardioides lijunqiniae]